MKNWLKIGIILLIVIISSRFASAATFNIATDNNNPAVGEEFHANVTIDSENVGINAAQATIKYSQDILEVRKIERTDSVFTFWLVEPTYDNATGEISFVGGSTSGFTGKSLQILKITFKTKGAGTPSIVFTDGAISASDGSGTNVLSASKGLEFSVLTKSEVTKLKPPQISREPIPADKAPGKPVLTVPLYPNPDGWYNLASDFVVKWDLPADVTAVATEINKVPDFAPTESEGLFDNKVFESVSNGTWYVHVRFKNNIGWGRTEHYRIALDTVPPLAFKLEVPTGLSTDNPTPELKYESKDQFSGISEYTIRYDGMKEISTDKTTYTLPPLPPGKKTILVSAKDKAGNTAEARVEIDILPIASPEVLSLRRDIFVGEGGLAISGVAIPESTVLIDLKNKNGDTVVHFETEANEKKGFWSISIDQPLKRGDYYLEATARDSRGALSLIVKSDIIKVRDRPILAIGGLYITSRLFIVLLLLLLIGTFGAGWYLQKLALRERRSRILIAQRDVNAAMTNIKADIEKIIEKHIVDGVPLDPSIESEVNFLLKKINDNIAKNRGYILDNIEEID